MTFHTKLCLDILLAQKSSVAYVFSCIYAKIKVDSYDSSHLEKTLTLHNANYLYRSFLNKHKNPYYYDIFLRIMSI